MKTVIEMAREAGGMFDHMMWLNRDLLPVYERLVELARADEREACAKVADGYVGADPIAAAIRARGQA